MSLTREYIEKNLNPQQFENELQKLIGKYNELRDTYLFVYSAAIDKQMSTQTLDISLNQNDYYLIHDILNPKKDIKKIDFYIETPGGSGETAEEIVRFLRRNFEKVSFVVSGQAKSAGTIMVLSGDEILMTDTGSLGPIDAQMGIGRSRMSAYDYLEWIDKKREEAEKNGKLNPFDAIMVAQITPGELRGVFHSKKFAEILVKDWLAEYKFKNWNITETRKIKVDEDYKKNRAEEIANWLTDNSIWKTHARSIKIDDLREKLLINRIDDNPKLAEIVYRIQIICRFLFDQTQTTKIFATEDSKLFRKAAVRAEKQIKLPVKAKPNVVEILQKCDKCGKEHKLYAKLIQSPQMEQDYKNKGFTSFPKNAKILCECGFEIDLLNVKNRIEQDIGKKILF